MLRVLSLLVALGITVPASANEPYRVPDAVDTAKAHAESHGAIEHAQWLARDPDQLRALTGAAPSLPAPQVSPSPGTFIDPSLVTVEKARIDVQKLLDQQPAASTTATAAPTQSAALIFVSFAMPEASFKSLLDESAKTGTSLVLRGMVDGSMKRTLERLRALVTGVTPNGPQPTITIDPTAYARFDVDKVPSFVFALEPIRPCERETCPTPLHLKVSGDVSLSYALDIMSRQAKSPAARAQVKAWLKRNGETP
jgi:conjugal transfer pilus assembly protein TrbC